MRPKQHKGAMNQLKVSLQHALIIVADGGMSGRNMPGS